MMFFLITILFLLFVVIGVVLVLVGAALYLFVWTANGKHTLEPALMFGSLIAIGLFTIWMACIDYSQFLQ